MHHSKHYTKAARARPHPLSLARGRTFTVVAHAHLCWKYSASVAGSRPPSEHVGRWGIARAIVAKGLHGPATRKPNPKWARRSQHWRLDAVSTGIKWCSYFWML